MNQSTIDEAIYNKYIAPTKLKKERYVGIEIEMPIVNLDKQPVDIEKVFDMSRNFQTEFSFDVCSEDDDHHANAMESPFTNDNLSFDCSYSNLELSMGKGKNIIIRSQEWELIHIITSMRTNLYQMRDTECYIIIFIRIKNIKMKEGYFMTIRNLVHIPALLRYRQIYFITN